MPCQCSLNLIKEALYHTMQLSANGLCMLINSKKPKGVRKCFRN